MATDRFDHIFIEPGVFDDAVSFYRDSLGWSEEFSWGQPGEPRGIGLSGGGIRIVLAEPHPAQDHSKTRGFNGHHPTIHIVVDDLDARYAELANKDLALFPPEPTHWGTRWFVVRDPDGNVIAYEEKRAR